MENKSKLTIKTPERRHWPWSDVFIVNFTYFIPYCKVRVCIVGFEQENVCYVPVLWIPIYSRAEWRHHSTVFIFNFEHISHLVLMFLLLILSMYLIAGFAISYFSRFWIKTNSSFMVYSFLERISTKCIANPLASASKQVFITNFNANCNVTVNYFLSFLSFDK